MDEDGFLSYMKEKKASLDKTNTYINRIRRFEKYLSENEDGKSIESSTAEDLERYLNGVRRTM